jgi:hypothetical protein
MSLATSRGPTTMGASFPLVRRRFDFTLSCISRGRRPCLGNRGLVDRPCQLQDLV